MPAPHSFWVILIGKTPTSFRAKEREDLVPTLRQLQRTQTDVTLRWFERGKVWESPEAAIGAAKLAETEAREKRTKEWRPGGEHRDPRARFELTRDQKRAKFKREQSGGSDRPASPFGPRPPRDERPRADRPREDRQDRPRGDRPREDHPRDDRPRGRTDRPWSDRPPSSRPKPGGARPDRPGFAPRPPRSDSRDRPERPGRPPSGDRPFGNRPFGDRPFGDRPPRRDRPSGPQMENPFKDRPRKDERPSPRPEGRPDRRPARPGRPSGDRGGLKPPKRRG